MMDLCDQFEMNRRNVYLAESVSPQQDFDVEEKSFKRAVDNTPQRKADLIFERFTSKNME